MMKIFKKITVVLLTMNLTQVLASMDWDELNNEQQKILLPFESSWDSLDDKAKDKLMGNTNKWLDKTPAQRMESRKKLNRYKQMPKAEREKYQQRFKNLKKLSPSERKEIEKAKRRFQKLSPKQRAMLKNKYNKLPPLERKKAIRQFNRKYNEKEFISKFDIEKRQSIREMFKSLGKLDRIKFRKSIKNASPKQRHQHVLELLEVEAKNRSSYIQALK